MISSRRHCGDHDFSGREQERYLRQITLSEIGRVGQRRLASARVLCIGVGGLGSPATTYLAAAGVGVLGIVDPDKVCRTNLHRQTLFCDSDIGRSKVDASIDRLRQVNPHCELIPHVGAFTPESALAIAEGYDLIIDGTDNFPTRYLSNDVSVQLGIPNVYASIYKYEGQISVFDPSTKGGCYRCMFPVAPSRGLVPSCAEGGVLGVLPGIVGTLQATESLKLILDIGSPLHGRLLHIDILGMKFREFQLRKDPNCPACGTRSLKIDDMNYDFECSTNLDYSDESKFVSISPQQLAKKLEENSQFMLIDVRESAEHSFSAIPCSVSMPLSSLEGASPEIDETTEVILYCSSEIRSRQAALELAMHGIKKISVLEGGVAAWASEIDDALPIL